MLVLENTIFLGNKEFTILYNEKSFFNDIVKRKKTQKIEEFEKPVILVPNELSSLKKDFLNKR